MKTRDQIRAAAESRRFSDLGVGRSALLATIGRGRTLRHHTTWPGSDVKIDIAVLTQAERADAQAAAYHVLRDRGINDGSPAPEHIDASATEHMVQILARAIRDPETDACIFNSGKEFAESVTEDELHALFMAYGDHRRSIDPEVEELSEEDFEVFLESAKKKDVVRQNAIASSMPRPLLLSLVARLSSSLTLNSSGTPLSEELPAED